MTEASMARRLTVGVMGSAGTMPAGVDDRFLDTLARELAGRIVALDCVLLTGETTGLPERVINAVRALGGMTVGVSPGHTASEQRERYQAPEIGSDVVIYTGFGLKGRNVVTVRSSDIIVIFGGSMGTLNELTIAYDEGKVIGILEGSGGVADLARELFKMLPKKSAARIVYDTDPAKLMDRCHDAALRERSPAEQLAHERGGQREG
jgi:uncharacterized protein (TIGR00725 family)